MKEQSKGIAHFVALAAMLVCGCAAVSPRVLVEPVESQVVEVKCGECITIQLEENCTTGYSWEARGETPGVRVVIEHLPPTLSRKQDGMLCGAPGMAKAVIRVGGDFKGDGTVRLVYRRPWSDEIAREVVLTLRRGEVFRVITDP